MPRLTHYRDQWVTDNKISANKVCGMIRKISIKNFKSFQSEEPSVINLNHTKRLGLFYGLNGAGKSAIGQVIYRNGNQIDPLPECSLEFTGEGQYQYLVYNEDFVEENFRNKDGFPGIFSIGKQDSEALRELEEKQKEASQLESRRDDLIERRKQWEQELNATFGKACDETWKVYTDHRHGPLKECTKKYGGSKSKLFLKLLSVSLNPGDAPPSTGDLVSRMRDVNATQASPKSRLDVDFGGFNEIETATVWNVPIIGSKDSSLAPLIERLRNIDWVKDGKKYLSDEVCPFCQQDLPHDFRDELSRLLDKTYQSQVNEVEALVGRYEQKIGSITAAMSNILATESFAEESGAIHQAWAELRRQLSENLSVMQRKKSAPGEKISIASSSKAVNAASQELAKINERIDAFNERIQHRDKEKNRIVDDFWKRMRYEYSGVIEMYNDAKNRVDVEMANLDTELGVIQTNLASIQGRLQELHSNSVGIDQAVEGINRRLESHGINAFKIKKKNGEDSLYCLDRPDSDGVDEYKSLSEGEKTLITFFYFVELVNGSLQSGAIIPQERKIVVVDDPISSLSHNYVYDISSIVVHEMFQAEPQIRQLLVLTHSLFFYHELVKQMEGIKKLGQCQYFRVVKREASDVRVMSKDEIKNEYQAFWQVIRDARNGDGSVASVPNAMRNIFEHFFAFVYQVDKFGAALHEMEKDDNEFTPLARYLHRKSHSDHINITDFGDHNIDYFLDKFRDVFERTGYLGHYNKMMGDMGDQEEGVA